MTKPERLELAVEATLLFHSGSPWDDQKSHRWCVIVSRLLGDSTGWSNDLSATTKRLCDIQRAALHDGK